MTIHSAIRSRPRLLDIRDNGMGDVVLACWIIESAAALGLPVQVNPRRWAALTPLLGMPAAAVTEQEGPHATRSPEIGLQYEYRAVGAALAAGERPRTRFALWCDSLGLSAPGDAPLRPVRPRYCESLADRAWACEQWQKVQERVSPGAPRVLVFPDTARPMRRWPQEHFRGLARAMIAKGWAVGAMASRQDSAAALGSFYWYGFSIGRTAAMIAQADLVIAADTGPAHLAGTIGTTTLAICGPTIGHVVFGHDANVHPLHAPPQMAPACAPCHFSAERGYGRSCEAEGCRALSALDPAFVLEAAEQLLDHRERMAQFAGSNPAAIARRGGGA